MKNDILKKIQKTAYEYFNDHTNFDPASQGFGLTVDHSMNQQVASIAATGFMLSSLVIGVENGYITNSEAYEKAVLTLKTLKDRASHKFGFFAHFLEMDSAERVEICEYSTIDTALCLCGVLTVDSYFKKKELTELAKDIFDRISWSDLIHIKNGKKILYMSYNPDKGGDYVNKKPGFIHQWDIFAEQIMMYVMIGGSKFADQALELYQGFEREMGSYGNYRYLFSPGNALFVYQFPLAWLDLKNIVDQDNISWFDNAKIATLAHQQCAIDYQNQYHTFSKYFFGFSGSDTPNGYRVYGALPNHGNKLDTDGTISPFGPIGSIIFTPEISQKSIEEMLKVQGLWGRYGFYDAFNFEGETPWISNRYISINKGLELLMVNAYLTQDVYKAFMSHEIILKGIEVLGWRRKPSIGGNKPSFIKSTP